MVKQGIWGSLLYLSACSLAYAFLQESGQDVRRGYEVEAAACVKSVGDMQIAACSRVIESGQWTGAHVAWAYNFRARAKEHQGEFPGALADANRDVELDPRSADAYIIRGNARYGGGDLEGAISDYNQAIKLDPKNAYAYIRRGIAMGKQGETDAAISDFNRAIDSSPRNSLAYACRGIEDGNKGNFNGALADFDRAIEIDPRNSLAYAGRAAAKLEKSGDLEGSISDDSRAIELAPRVSIGYRQRGMAYFFRGELDRAAQDLIRAHDLNSDAYAAIWLYLVRSHAKMAARKELADNTVKLDKASWPAPIIGFYLGNSTPAALIEAAKNPDPRTMTQHVCEAKFYLAEWQLLRNDRTDALELFHAAAEQCPLGFFERAGAGIELRRLSRSPE